MQRTIKTCEENVKNIFNDDEKKPISVTSSAHFVLPAHLSLDSFSNSSPPNHSYFNDNFNDNLINNNNINNNINNNYSQSYNPNLNVNNNNNNNNNNLNNQSY